MEKIVEQGSLYDFYGELLTEHQRKIYEDAVYNDLSLSEIAEMQGISRQGVHDLIRRCNRILGDYESKLHLIKRFDEIKDKVRQMNELAEDETVGQKQLREKMKQLTGEILEAL